MVADWKALRDWSRRERARRGWTQGDLAREAGVSIKTVNDLESGRSRTRFNKLPEIELAFGVSAGTAARVLEGAEPEPEAAQQDLQTDYARPLDFYRRLVLNLVDDPNEQLRLLAKVDAHEREIEEEIRGAQDRSA